MLAGELYLANDPPLIAERKRAKAFCAEYNGHPAGTRNDLLAELFGAPTNAWLEPPFWCDYGTNMRLGTNVYANHNFVVLDCALVTLGDNVFIGPNVVLSTAGHPIEADVRISGLEFAKPITIGNDVWIGASVVIVPGVEIGAGTTIGAGSVVTRSIPAGVIAFGNPCRIVRHLP